MRGQIVSRRGALSPFVARMLVLLLALASATTVVFAFVHSRTTTITGVQATRVTSNSALLLARTPQAGRVRFEISCREDFASIDVFSFDYVVHTERPARAWLTGLRPGTHYFCRTTNETGTIASGQFTTGGSM